MAAIDRRRRSLQNPHRSVLKPRAADLEIAARGFSYLKRDYRAPVSDSGVAATMLETSAGMPFGNAPLAMSK